MSERLRWNVAYLLDRLPGMCWANLVSWALRRQSLRETRQDSVCREDTARNGVCYCGKRRLPDADKIARHGRDVAVTWYPDRKR